MSENQLRAQRSEQKNKIINLENSNPDKFQFQNVYPRKLDKNKSDTILNTDDLDITKAVLKKSNY